MGLSSGLKITGKHTCFLHPYFGSVPNQSVKQKVFIFLCDSYFSFNFVRTFAEIREIEAQNIQLMNEAGLNIL